MTRHPVELYAALLLAAAAVVVALARRRWSPQPGVVAGIGLALAAAARLVTEPLRPVIGSPRTVLYAVGLAVGLALVAVSAFRERRGLDASVHS